MDPGLDHERCYRAVCSRDARFDGEFVTAVITTGIYCRPSCPATTPLRSNVTFFRSAAAAHGAGFRACRRCAPDAAPGSAAWNMRTDVVARAMRMLDDGGVERIGVAGIAAALGYSERHLNRLVTAELGAGLLSIARSRRAHTARVLLETTGMPVSAVAWAAGFGSIRSLNETCAAVYGQSPSALRGRVRRTSGTEGSGAASHAAAHPSPGGAATVRVRLAAREPLGAAEVLGFLGARALAGVESWDGTTYRRSLALPHGHAVVGCVAEPGSVSAVFHLADVRDLAAGVARVRRLLDLDADPAAVADVLGRDAVLDSLLRRHPGIRVPGSVDAHETVVRAIVGQQVSVRAARSAAGRLVAELGATLGVAEQGATFGVAEHGATLGLAGHGATLGLAGHGATLGVAEHGATLGVAEHGATLGLAGHQGPVSVADPPLDRLFPTVEALACVDPASLPMPGARAAALVGCCAALAEGRIVLDPGCDRSEAVAALQQLRGIGPWTTGYVALRGLADPDVLLSSDLGVRRAVAQLGGDDSPAALEQRGAAWRPWRSYAVVLLWGGGQPASNQAEPRLRGVAP